MLPKKGADMESAPTVEARRRILAAGEYPSAKKFLLYIPAKVCYNIFDVNIKWQKGGERMTKYILIALVAIVILAPEILWRVYARCKREERTKEFYSKPFVCPNCGFRFYAKASIMCPASESKALLKCPSCGKRDLCGRPYDFEDDQRR